MKKPKKLFDKHTSLPKLIKLGYQDITVTEIDSIDFTQGSYTNESHEIKIKSGMEGREQLNTVLHEIAHSIAYIYGIKSEFKDDEQEEKVINVFGNGLTEVLVRNPEFVRFIVECVR